MTTSTTIPKGFYPDPTGAPHLRWWDGRQWTGATTIPAAPSSPRQRSNHYAGMIVGVMFMLLFVAVLLTNRL